MIHTGHLRGKFGDSMSLSKKSMEWRLLDRARLPVMRKFITCLAVLALVFSVGCGGDKSDGCSAGCGAGCGDGCAPTEIPNKGDADATAKKEITYKCNCGKEKTLAADKPAPS